MLDSARKEMVNKVVESLMKLRMDLIGRVENHRLMDFSRKVGNTQHKKGHQLH